MSFAPGHISLTFAIKDAADPLKMGSTGLGIILPQGVYCSVVDEESEINENIVFEGNKEIDDPVVLRALELLGHGDRGLSIYLRRDLPIGSGFGISGASALAACIELDNDLERCKMAAHQAEIEYKTGLGDVVAISAALDGGNFPIIVERKSPGANGEVTKHPVNSKLAICISGLGRNTSDIITSPEWIEIINTVSSNLEILDYDIRSVIKVGRTFTEKSGLIDENLVEILDSIPLGAVSSIAHLGTSVVAISDNIAELSKCLETYGEVRIY